MKVLSKAGLLIMAVLVNLALFLLVPLTHVLFGGLDLRRERTGPPVTRELVTHIPPSRIEKVREIKEIKPVTPQLPRLGNPGARVLNIDLSPAGGEGMAIASGGSAKGVPGGQGNLDVITYEAGQTDIEAKLVTDAPLNYPARANREGVSGYVDITWVVTSSGYSEEVQILKEQPEGYGFGKEAIVHVKKLKFKPASLNKVPVRQRLKRRLNFDQ